MSHEGALFPPVDGVPDVAPAGHTTFTLYIRMRVAGFFTQVPCEWQVAAEALTGATVPSAGTGTCQLV